LPGTACDGLSALGKPTALKLLELSGAATTVEGRTRPKRDMPGCEIRQ
jgi:hypothetical protein